MATADEVAQFTDRFSAVARQFCSVVDSASRLDRTALLGSALPNPSCTDQRSYRPAGCVKR